MPHVLIEITEGEQNLFTKVAKKTGNTKTHLKGKWFSDSLRKAATKAGVVKDE